MAYFDVMLQEARNLVVLSETEHEAAYIGKSVLYIHLVSSIVH